MNLNKPEKSLLLNKKNTGTLIQQTKTRPQETFEFKISFFFVLFRNTFSLYIPSQLEDRWTMGVTNSEVFNSTFNKREKNNKIITFSPGYNVVLLLQSTREKT